MAEKLKRFGIKFAQILQHFQQDLKHWVSGRKIMASRLHELQETQFLDLVQDVRYSTLVEYILYFWENMRLKTIPVNEIDRNPETLVLQGLQVFGSNGNY